LSIRPEPLAGPPSSPFAGRPVCLTTRHGKQRALERPFRVGLGVTLQLSSCDTDQLGTFSGEVERAEDALATCRRKALLGLEQTGLRLGVASEGSFGPHPVIPWLPAGQEHLVFLDLDRDLCIREQRLELRTNYSQLLLEPNKDPGGWLRQVGFPRHGVIVRPADQSIPLLFKGLVGDQPLQEALARCRAADPSSQVWIETDMRAHLNPTRMRSIRALACDLVRRLRSPCPDCAAPGWGLQDTVPGLPCGCCGTPTPWAAQEVWGCQVCGASRPQPRRDGLRVADPAQCLYCNP